MVGRMWRPLRPSTSHRGTRQRSGVLFAVNTNLNLGDHERTGERGPAHESFKSGSMGVLTLTWLVALALIIIALA
jgi:hypothetical protein